MVPHSNTSAPCANGMRSDLYGEHQTAEQLVRPDVQYQELIRNLGGGQALRALRRSAVQPGELSADLEQERTREEKQVFAADIARLNKRILEARRGLLDPRGKIVQYWDMCSAAALMYTMFVTPYEVGMNLPTEFNSLFICNQVVTAIFVVDVIMQFFLPQKKRGANGSGDASFERRHWKLAKRYLLGYFTLDIVTIIPFDVLVWQGVFEGQVKMIKILRVLRLLKVAKVLRASSIIQRWENTVAIPSTKQQLGGFAVLTIVLLHWFSCVWTLLAHLWTSQRVGQEAALEEELLSLSETQSHCFGCIAADASTMKYCRSQCLTPCERTALAKLTGALAENYHHHRQPRCRTEWGLHIRKHWPLHPELDRRSLGPIVPWAAC